jgi:hypothetical protein
MRLSHHSASSINPPVAGPDAQFAHRALEGRVLLRPSKLRLTLAPLEPSKGRRAACLAADGASNSSRVIASSR